jgi:hypothetical protein
MRGTDMVSFLINRDICLQIPFSYPDHKLVTTLFMVLMYQYPGIRG